MQNFVMCNRINTEIMIFQFEPQNEKKLSSVTIE